MPYIAKKLIFKTSCAPRIEQLNNHLFDIFWMIYNEIKCLPNLLNILNRKVALVQFIHIFLSELNSIVYLKFKTQIIRYAYFVRTVIKWVELERLFLLFKLWYHLFFEFDRLYYLLSLLFYRNSECCICS
jgi:hypothetical protein